MQMIPTTQQHKPGDFIYEGGYEYEVISTSEIIHPVTGKVRNIAFVEMTGAMDMRPVLDGTGY